VDNGSVFYAILQDQLDPFLFFVAFPHLFFSDMGRFLASLDIKRKVAILICGLTCLLVSLIFCGPAVGVGPVSFLLFV